MKISINLYLIPLQNNPTRLEVYTKQNEKIGGIKLSKQNLFIFQTSYNKVCARELLNEIIKQKHPIKAFVGQTVNGTSRYEFNLQISHSPINYNTFSYCRRNSDVSETGFLMQIPDDIQYKLVDDTYLEVRLKYGWTIMFSKNFSVPSFNSIRGVLKIPINDKKEIIFKRRSNSAYSDRGWHDRVKSMIDDFNSRFDGLVDNQEEKVV